MKDAPRVKARKHEIMKCVQSESTDGSASRSKHPTDVPLYQISSHQIKSRRATASWGFRGSARIACRGCTRHGGRGATPGTGPAFGPLDVLALPSTTSCLVSASWESVGRRSNGSIRKPPPPSHADSQVQSANATACDSARSPPALRRKSPARLLHACAS